jgi:hypothetical protein
VWKGAAELSASVRQETAKLHAHDKPARVYLLHSAAFFHYLESLQLAPESSNEKGFSRNLDIQLDRCPLSFTGDAYWLTISAGIA